MEKQTQQIKCTGEGRLPLATSLWGRLGELAYRSLATFGAARVVFCAENIQELLRIDRCCPQKRSTPAVQYVTRLQ